jgi:hypothetical protein
LSRVLSIRGAYTRRLRRTVEPGVPSVRAEVGVFGTEWKVLRTTTVISLAITLLTAVATLIWTMAK